MTSINFKKWNNILGWFAFFIALLTYSLTVEPTVSYWDAGEYILTSAKLQVGHPPGAPLFQMLGAFFSTFAIEPQYVGLMLNMVSAVSSAFTILFMFWSISLLLQKIVGEQDLTNSKIQGILASAFVGSLAFTFTDSFWFNAVETEVYAMATLIMAILFYLGLRWERDMNNPRGNRWLILIAFVIGLSFGVHFMGLLTIPALGLIYYFKNYKKVTIVNFIVANVVSVAILLFIFKLLAPNILRFFSALEIFFVNTIGLPFNSGSIIAGLILIAAIYFSLNYTQKKGYKHLNTGILCITFVVIGFSSWLMLPIRANANVVINENNPSSARELLAYYNLEQYPETHLFYGPLFTDQYSGLDEDKPYVDDKPKYEKDEALGKYVIVNDYKNAKQNYNSDQAAILPRMWSGENAENYMLFSGFLDFSLKEEYIVDPFTENKIADFISKYQNNQLTESEYDGFMAQYGDKLNLYLNQGTQKDIALINQFKNEVVKGNVDYEGYHNFLKTYGQQYLDIKKPSLGSNIAYLLEYQLGYMYWRYFMWNFTGRQDDIQGEYNNHGNWISGIKAFDAWHLGQSQDNLPSDVENNKARNTYYFLPLILGLIGLFFIFNKDKKLFWVLLVFFLFTGLAIQVYTNVRPFEPRERDYSVVGSFYVFAIWIGFGVYAIFDMLKTKIKNSMLAPAVGLVCLILVPGILAANNWDDHDRSNKYTALSMAKKYLDSCAENAILFSIGDNDTFALWYAQEIENYRTDVRVVNTSLFQTDWYIDQMKRKAYESDPVPSQLTHDQYKYGTRDYIMKRTNYYDPKTEEYKPTFSRDTLSIKEFLDFVSSDNPKTKFKRIIQLQGEDPKQYPSQLLNTNYFPVENIRVPVNKNEVLSNGLVKEKDADQIVDYIDIKIKESAIYKQRLLMLDIVGNNNWERPIYFTGGAFGDDDYIWMKDYLQLDGMCYKLVPIKTPVERANPFDMGRVDSDLMYNKVKNWDWGNSGSDKIYHDPETRKNAITYRGNLARLMETLINEKQLEKAEEIADIAMENMPVNYYGYYTLLEPYISGYYEVDAKEKARQLFKDVAVKYQENLKYYSELTRENQLKNGENIITDLERYRALIIVLVEYDEDFAEEEFKTFQYHEELFSDLMPSEQPIRQPQIREERDINRDSSIPNLTPQTTEE
ncbi:DUF2723 domain-containing protein [Lacinutrix sp. MedPE-SW]|mgnify:CR=1 FL=1|uniref:glycosyltransferase family 117 protein n=1 Tax=Lacinutrix sp. MedPE-SW TaxID=1860087 RepID=UPI00091EAEED|nr:DUF2723 domain-containing protein [Lacinutrix sp. MedPE-SW]OIQ23207.1 MAG: hypothetical protein BM549_04125 [Lacinutrix sp. MedPE-SW]